MNYRYPLVLHHRPRADIAPRSALLFVRAFVAVEMMFFCAGTVAAQIQGESELLAETTRRHAANRERIVTWRGRVVTKGSARWPAREKLSLTGERMSAVFAWDAKTGAKRWTCKWDEAWFQDRVGPRQQQGRDIESGMLKDSAYYWLSTPDRSRPCTLIVYPSDEAKKVMGSPFTFCIDPEYFLTYDGTLLDRFLQVLYDSRDDPKSTGWTVSRDGDLVVAECKRRFDDGTTAMNRLEIDWGQGANLVRFASSSSNGNQEWTWQHENVSGVWVPRKFSVEHHQKAPPATTTREIQWVENVLNEPIKDETFSLTSMGALPGDVVSDSRSGVQYTIQADDVDSGQEGELASRRHSWLIPVLIGAVVVLAVLWWLRRRTWAGEKM